jgi:hypothetical protein
VPWTLNGTSAFYNGGNIGIGTDSPSAPLEVAGSSIFGGDMTFDTPGPWRIMDSSTTGLRVDPAGTTATIVAGGADVVLVEPNAVGIAQPNPFSNNFHVGLTARFDDSIYFSALSSNIEVAHDNNDGMVIDAINRKVHLEVDAGNILTADQNGNVGINNENPTVALDVNGDAHVEGSLTIQEVERTLILTPSVFEPDGADPTQLDIQPEPRMPRLVRPSNANIARAMAEVRLPVGATITQLEAIAADFSNAGNIEVELTTSRFAAPLELTFNIGAVVSSGQPGEVLLATPAQANVVPERMYYVTATLDSGSGGIFLYGVRVTYTVTSLLP